MIAVTELQNSFISSRLVPVEYGWIVPCSVVDGMQVSPVHIDGPRFPCRRVSGNLELLGYILVGSPNSWYALPAQGSTLFGMQGGQVVPH